ncbi:hypothetical protein P885DRAFT_64675 [Corynascus similis CBS 632.67]
MLSHIGLMRNPRASKDMVPDEIWELMPPDPKLEALKAERARLKGGRYRRQTAIQRAYRKQYFHNRHTWDMEVNGEVEEEYVEPATDLQIPERAQLAEILYNRPNNLSPAELLELRIQAAKLMVILCGKRETVRPDRIRRRVQGHADVTVREESLGSDPFPILMDRNQCLRYIGDEMLSYEERTFKYCRAAVLYDHFDRKHAAQLGGKGSTAIKLRA